MDEVRPTSGAQAHGLVPLFPPGLQAIYGECRRLYPDQANPLQVTAIVKYWYVPTPSSCSPNEERTLKNDFM